MEDLRLRRRDAPPGIPSRARVCGGRPGRGFCPKPGRWPGVHTSGYRGLQPAQRADRQVEPRIQLEESASGFRYKQTDSDAHRRVKPPTLKWRGRRPRAGLHAVARERPPAANYPGPHVRLPPFLRARGSPPSGLGRRSCSRAAGATRGPGDGPDSTSGYRGLQPAQRGRKTVLDSSAGREVEPASTGRSRRPKPGGNRSLPWDLAITPTPTDSDGTCQTTSRRTPRGHRAQAVTSAQMSPVTTPHRGPGGTSE